MPAAQCGRQRFRGRDVSLRRACSRPIFRRRRWSEPRAPERAPPCSSRWNHLDVCAAQACRRRRDGVQNVVARSPSAMRVRECGASRSCRCRGADGAGAPDFFVCAGAGVQVISVVFCSSAGSRSVARNAPW